jgi:hypothetical protein
MEYSSRAREREVLGRKEGYYITKVPEQRGGGDLTDVDIIDEVPIQHASNSSF